MLGAAWMAAFTVHTPPIWLQGAEGVPLSDAALEQLQQTLNRFVLRFLLCLSALSAALPHAANANEPIRVFCPILGHCHQTAAV